MNFEELKRLAYDEWAQLESSQVPLVFVGDATCGRAAGSTSAMEVFRGKIESLHLDCRIIEVGCIGLCYAEPVVCIKKPSQPAICYGEVTPRRAEELVDSYLLKDDPLAHYALGSIGDGVVEGISDLFQTPVLKQQVRVILRNCGFIDPAKIKHSIANGGYSGLAKALTIQPEQIIEEVKRSGLRGRGGAGFPTWKKWQFCSEAKEKKRYLICNADEGDPGAFMNRSLIEGDPHSLIEGMIIAGFAIGAHESYIYCRAEYPLALERLRVAIQQAQDCGLLGDNILNSGFSFDIIIKEGAGAFVCGEETALIASIEGRRGMPRPRPPFPAVCGLWQKPTIINNVETLASVAFILQKEADVFAKYGTEQSKGTKTFALVGQVKRTGLIEVPLGITLREIIYDIGGGVLNDKPFKAVQTGGPSGGCIPRDLLDVPIDYDSLASAGSIMGSGGMVVMDENTCMVDFARYFLDFAQKESCGECVPCRLGTKQILDILEDITIGKGKQKDLDLLIKLAESVKLGSLCALGQTAPNPVLSTIKYFKSEYEAHIKEKRCPSGVCRELIRYSIKKEECVGCGACRKVCPHGAISGKQKKLHKIIDAKCNKCGICKETCKFKAISIE
ncbi:NADH-quinone oxidoreductase subunit NuoF [Candidatus Omnitrophota bacterium]